jgi:CDP-4-dehydro-6-deoxyglucose reductase, E1
VGGLTNTDFIMNNTFFIGVYPGIDERQLDHMATVFDRFMNGERAGTTAESIRIDAWE